MAELEEIKKKYYAIGEVAAMLEVKASLIRFWETEFPQLSPRKNKKGNRVYTDKEIEVLRTIYYLVKIRKFTLKGAREKMKMNPKDLESEQKTMETLLKVRGFLEELKNNL
ncbi:MAG TPA: MerR family transcriptional regulator [Bacteroidetes bacterium]|nr:MerR family transcriptional regulator [Bacteroidota bacterium]